MDSLNTKKNGRFGKSFKMNNQMVTNAKSRTRFGVNSRRKNRSNFRYTPKNKAINNSNTSNALGDLL